MSDEPALSCLVARAIVDRNGRWYGFVDELTVVRLERAVELHEEGGWVILVDPLDEQALTRWEAIRRSQA